MYGRCRSGSRPIIAPDAGGFPDPRLRIANFAAGDGFVQRSAARRSADRVASEPALRLGGSRLRADRAGDGGGGAGNDDRRRKRWTCDLAWVRQPRAGRARTWRGSRRSSRVGPAPDRGGRAARGAGAEAVLDPPPATGRRSPAGPPAEPRSGRNGCQTWRGSRRLGSRVGLRRAQIHPHPRRS